MQLQDKQIRFVSEFLIDLNGSAAAVRAGYSRNSARQIATRLLSKVHIRVLVQKKQKEAEERLQISRDDVMQGLLRAAQEARVAGNQMAMIRAYREIGLMMGYYDQPAAQAPQDVNEDQLRAMSDRELEALCV